jgi:CheY-like chemotaxis protein
MVGATAINGTEALAVAQCAPDLVLIDVAIPELKRDRGDPPDQA